MIYFDLDKSNIRAEAALDLEKILDVLNQNPTMKLTSDLIRIADKHSNTMKHYRKEEPKLPSTGWLKMVLIPID
jgi:hypothetical protein